VCSTYGEYGGGPVVPIGRPIANVRAYVLDKDLSPVPIGIVGDLCISGVGLARGYLGRPELTAEKFLSCSLREAHERIYKTGDLARYLPDGNIEFLGRADQQHKIRGFRVELGEIESALLKHPAVVECTTMVREKDSRKEIVAYLVVRNSVTDVSGRAVKKWLRTQLPEYMVPSHVVLVDSMPKTASGKVNRKALPAPEPERDPGSVFLAPRTETERFAYRFDRRLRQFLRLGRRFFGVHRGHERRFGKPECGANRATHLRMRKSGGARAAR
jgi:acyl-coenzyme A synthetase/AMP-(fatty) acid ligase